MRPSDRGSCGELEMGRRRSPEEWEALLPLVNVPQGSDCMAEPRQYAGLLHGAAGDIRPHRKI